MFNLYKGADFRQIRSDITSSVTRPVKKLRENRSTEILKTDSKKTSSDVPSANRALSLYSFIRENFYLAHEND